MAENGVSVAGGGSGGGEGSAGPPPGQPPVVVKKYANRRLYNTETSSYITLDNLAEMIRAGRDFVVYDAKSSEDITRGVLTQIIVEEESKGSSMLPTTFLRQLIGFYGGNLQGVVPRYLDQAMSNFARQQQQMRAVMQQTFGSFMPMGVEEMSRQNMAMIERAMSLFNPFHRAESGAEAVAVSEAPVEASAEAGSTEAGPTEAEPAANAEMERLRHEVESLKHQLAVAHAEGVVARANAAAAAPAPDGTDTAANVRADPPAGGGAARRGRAKAAER